MSQAAFAAYAVVRAVTAARLGFGFALVWLAALCWVWALCLSSSIVSAGGLPSRRGRAIYIYIYTTSFKSQIVN